MNTNNWDQHQIRLNKFVESKQRVTFFIQIQKLVFIKLLVEEKKFIANEMFTANFTSCNLATYRNDEKIRDQTFKLHGYLNY